MFFWKCLRIFFKYFDRSDLIIDKTLSGRMGVKNGKLWKTFFRDFLHFSVIFFLVYFQNNMVFEQISGIKYRCTRIKFFSSF